MDDLISRSALLKRMNKIQKYCEKRGYGDGAWNIPIMFVNEAPAVDAAPVVHGRWKQRMNDDFVNCIAVCSKCRYPTSWFTGRSKFCPNCGARMDLPEGEEARDDG